MMSYITAIEVQVGFKKRMGHINISIIRSNGSLRYLRIPPLEVLATTEKLETSKMIGSETNDSTQARTGDLLCVRQMR